MSLTKVIPALIDTTGASSNQFLRFDGTNATWQTVSVSSGAQINTQTVQTSTVSSTSYSVTFSFVVGQVFIEYLDNTPANQNSANVLASAWINLRSYDGVKTNNTANRYGYYGWYYDGSTMNRSAFRVDRTTNGTVVVVNKPRTAMSVNTTGTSAGANTSLAAFSDQNFWNANYTLRITAIEDTQS
jgi:hypothetical protein